eukprot:COSAG01_NODE_362_length_18130_cov_34.672307_16_plen_113_part_00
MTMLGEETRMRIASTITYFTDDETTDVLETSSGLGPEVTSMLQSLGMDRNGNFVASDPNLDTAKIRDWLSQPSNHTHVQMSDLAASDWITCWMKMDCPTFMSPKNCKNFWTL